LAQQVGEFLRAKQGRKNRHLAHQDFDKQGFITVSLNATTFDATLWSVEETQSLSPFEGDEAALDALFERTHFRLEADDKSLYKEVEGAWLRWDKETMEWV